MMAVRSESKSSRLIEIRSCAAEILEAVCFEKFCEFGGASSGVLWWPSTFDFWHRYAATVLTSRLASRNQFQKFAQRRDVVWRIPEKFKIAW